MKSSKHFSAPPDARDQRLDSFLAGRLEEYSRSRLRGLIRAGGVKVNGRRSKAHYRLAAGDRVEIQLPLPEDSGPLPQPIPLEVVYEDEDIIVINKPPGLLVHPVRAGQDGTVVNALLFHSGRLSSVGGPLRRGIVHRLDRDTSGLLMAAKSDSVHHKLARQFKERSLEKEYLALVRGRPPRERGELAYPIGRRARRRTKMTVKYIGGRESLTVYQVLEGFRDRSYLRLLLRTGRTHQIRVHLARLGCPVLGDSRYGRERKRDAKKTGVARQMLHAHRLKFTHPSTGKVLELVAPLPADMEAVLSALQRENS